MLVQQAASNGREQFVNSPDLKDALVHAVTGALEAHTAMSSQALTSERVREGVKHILLGPGQLNQSLRARRPLPQANARSAAKTLAVIWCNATTSSKVPESD